MDIQHKKMICYASHLRALYYPPIKYLQTCFKNWLSVSCTNWCVNGILERAAVLSRVSIAFYFSLNVCVQDYCIRLRSCKTSKSDVKEVSSWYWLDNIPFHFSHESPTLIAFHSLLTVILLGKVTKKYYI